MRILPITATQASFGAKKFTYEEKRRRIKEINCSMEHIIDMVGRFQDSREEAMISMNLLKSIGNLQAQKDFLEYNRKDDEMLDDWKQDIDGNLESSKSILFMLQDSEAEAKCVQNMVNKILELQKEKSRILYT